MDEFEEPSDVEMVPIEEIEKARAALTLDSQIPDDEPEKPVDTFTTGIDIFSKEEKLKMEERAKRFGLIEKPKESSNVEEDLYSSMGIVDDGENAKNIRLNVIHMRGTEEMSTKDVFKYFQDYAPTSIEWINDVSCNIVWFDKVTAARAMLGLSKRISGSVAKYSDRENDSENRKEDIVMANEELVDTDKNEKEENCINIKDINYPLPPGVWRKGVDYPKSKGIFLRFATRADKKQINAEKKSEYYKKYGNPNFGGLKGILTESRKRMYKQTKPTKHKSLIEDDTDEQNQTKNPWGSLSETWGLNDVVEDDFRPKNGARDQGRSIKERLGLKCTEKETPQAEESGEASSSSDSDENWCKRSKIPRMRMHADDEEEKVQKRRAKLRFQMILNNLNSSGDLRSKLRSKTKAQYREPIQVVVTNTNATNSKRDNSGAIRQQIAKEIELSDREEGEWQESEDEDGHEEEDKVEQRSRGLINVEEEQKEGEEEEEDDEEEEGEHKEDEEDSEEDSDVPAKEVQGPKGSVIKVVPPKPRIASTVWARLNHAKSEASDSYLKKRPSGSRDLRSTLKGDLRSRIGNHTRGRSPLRIEVKNDKYTRNSSDPTSDLI
ncbi:hypothetical protein PUN28_004154 [Cardiocondyla obscurior]|uniref:Nuclear cap-binding protein subunit 3 n=1 Tax=Cardiocondyla obscurior TaxID=286306 RepID=A0AAW2GPT4_9HYME